MRAYDDATDSERHQGGRWYEDAHQIASAVGKHTGVGKHVMAGLFAAYSPQMQFHSAVHNAVRTAHEGEPVRQGQGPYVSNQHAAHANKILSGTNHQEALGGAKSQDTAHLIEHGGRDAETGGWSHRVAVGHQEFAVASGLGYADEQSERDGRKVLGNRHYYDHLSGLYHQAAQHISQRDGVSLAGHHVQATVNLAAGRVGDEDGGVHGPSPRERREVGQTRKYLTDRHPELGEGNTHLAYGETKAPQQVDTLRDEACPVCGETDAWDGVTCKVCGFVQPPEKFQDPDVDMAKKLDPRNNDDPGPQDVDDLNADLNDADGDGLDDNTGEPVAGDQQPLLTCPACGYEEPAGEPESVSTEDPVMGDASSESEGSQAGDLCPNCGKAPLMSPEEMAESGLGEPEDEQRDEDELNGEDPTEDGDSGQPGEPDSRESGNPFDQEDDDSDAAPPGDEEEPDPEDDENGKKPAKRPFPPGKK